LFSGFYFVEPVAQYIYCQKQILKRSNSRGILSHSKIELNIMLHNFMEANIHKSCSDFLLKKSQTEFKASVKRKHEEIEAFYEEAPNRWTQAKGPK
jgi:hypothetical protein